MGSFLPLVRSRVKRVKEDNKICIKYPINIIYPYDINIINTLEISIKYFGPVVSQEALGPTPGGHTVEEALASRSPRLAGQGDVMGERHGHQYSLCSVTGVTAEGPPAGGPGGCRPRREGFQEGLREERMQAGSRRVTSGYWFSEKRIF